MIANYFLKLVGVEDDRVLAKLMIVQYKDFLMNTIGSTVYTIAIVLAIPGAIHTTEVLIWAGLQFLLKGIQFFQTYTYLKSPEESRNYMNWYRIGLFMCLIFGILWGLLPITFYQINNELTAMVAVASFMLIVSGGLGFNALPGGYLAFGIPGMLLVSISFITLEPDFMVFGIMGIIYIIFSVHLTLHNNRNVAEATLLRFKNEDMIEEVKTQREKAEKSNHDKSRFLAAASHDLRQPLQAIALFSAALDVDDLEPETRNKILSNMQRSIEGLEGLFNSLLDISRLDSGVIEVDKRHFPLPDVMKPIHSAFSNMAQKKGIDLDILEEAPLVYSDHILLQRIIGNLISNAVRYTDSGTITVSYQLIDNDKIKISVKDTGIGINAENLNEVFSEFYQINNPERDRSKGLGLGLSIVKRLCLLLDYPLEVKSKPGKGSEFSLIIPKGDSTIYENALHPQALSNIR